MSLNKNKSGSPTGLLDPAGFGEGLWPGGRAKIVKAAYVMYQGPQSRQPRAPVAQISFKDATGEIHEERWGLGKDAEKRFKVIEGGKRIEGVNGAKPNKSCKLARLINTIEATAWEWDTPGVGNKSAAISDLVGYTADWKREVMEVGEAIKADRAKSGKTGDITVLVVEDFVEGGEAEEVEAEPEAEAGTEVGSDDTPAGDEAEVDLAPLAKAAIEEILGDAPGGELEVSKLQAAMLKHCESLEDDDPLKLNTDVVVDAAGQTSGEEAFLVEQGFAISEKKNAKGKKETWVGVQVKAKPKLGLGKKTK